MKIIACQDDFIMTSVEIIELDAMGIRFENNRYLEVWHFDSEEQAGAAFLEVWKEIHTCIRKERDCILDETIIKERVNANINQVHV